MKITGKTVLGIFLLVALAVFLGIGYLIYSTFANASQYRTAYRQIKVGDSKEKVVELFGKPGNVLECRHFDKPNCAEVYRYSGIFEGWYLIIDTTGKVVDKGHSASG